MTLPAAAEVRADRSLAPSDETASDIQDTVLLYLLYSIFTILDLNQYGLQGGSTVKATPAMIQNQPSNRPARSIQLGSVRQSPADQSARYAPAAARPGAAPVEKAIESNRVKPRITTKVSLYE